MLVETNAAKHVVRYDSWRSHLERCRLHRVIRPRQSNSTQLLLMSGDGSFV